MTARKFLALPLAFVGGVILASFAACTETNDNHCSVKGGDEYCQEKTGNAAGEVFCTNNCGGDYDVDGCLVASEAPAEGCWLCDGEGSQNCGDIGDGDSDSTDADTETTADTDATETMDTTTAETGPECTMSGDCAVVGEPLCDVEACVGCGDAVTASCAADYPETPVCDAGSGACVECTVGDVSACPAEEPACEGGVCVPCDEHEQCPDSACNMATGACMPTDRVWWVDQSVGMSGSGMEAAPFKTLLEAMNMIGMDQEGTIYLKTSNDHQEQLVVPAGRTVALVGKSDTGGLRNNLAAAILSDGTIFIHGLLVNGGTTGLDCAQGLFWITDTVISVPGRGLSADGCEGTVRRSHIVDNGQSSIRLIVGALKIENSFIGGDISNRYAIDILDGAVDISYSTVLAGFGTSAAIHCFNGGAGSTVRNSILATFSADPEVAACAQMEISGSALETAMPNNAALGNLDVSWFLTLAATQNDFHLTGSAPAALADAAIWQTGDPKTDIDGDARPTVDGTADYAGADVPN